MRSRRSLQGRSKTLLAVVRLEALLLVGRRSLPLLLEFGRSLSPDSVRLRSDRFGDVGLVFGDLSSNIPQLASVRLS